MSSLAFLGLLCKPPTVLRGGSRRLCAREVVRCCASKVEVTKEVVEKTARLASLELSDSEVEKITPEFQRIIGFVEQINNLDVEGVEPTLRVEDISNVFRQDEPQLFPAQDELMSEAPQMESDFVRVPKILKEED